MKKIGYHGPVKKTSWLNFFSFSGFSDGAPTALVSLIGHNQYKKCAKDIYYFLQVKSPNLLHYDSFFSSPCHWHFIQIYWKLQSTVCVKQLAYGILELLVISVFPELRELVLDIHAKKWCVLNLYTKLRVLFLFKFTVPSGDVNRPSQWCGIPECHHF